MSSRAAMKAKRRQLFPYGRPKEYPKPESKPRDNWFIAIHEKLHRDYANQNRRGGYWNYPYGYTLTRTCCIFGGKIMNIPVIHEDETENEFDIEMCCEACASKNYGWTAAQYLKVFQQAEKGEPIQIPDSVTDETKFRAFVKTL